MGFVKKVLELHDAINSDVGLQSLQNLMSRENPDQILKQCTSMAVLSSVDGPVFLRLCLLGCQPPRTRELQFKIVEEVIKVLMLDSNLPNNAATNLVCILQQHFDDTLVETHKMVKLVSVLVSHLDDNIGSALYSRWLSLLSKLLVLVGEKDYVIASQSDEEEIPGKEFRARTIRSLCNIRWSGNLGVSLIMMFRETELTSDEMQGVLEKICNSIMKLDSLDVPPLLYQALLLCKTSNDCMMLLVAVIAFYNKKFVARSSSESEDMIDTHNFAESSLSESSSTVIFHISHAIKMGHSVGKDIIKLLRSSSDYPEVIFSPFTLFLALSLSSDRQFQAQITECLRSTTIKAIGFGLKRESNAWMKSTCKNPPDVAKAFHEVITMTTKHGGWDLIGKGVFDAAIAFLDTSPPMIGNADRKLKLLWSVGSVILRDIIKCQPDAISLLMKDLSKRLIFSRAAVRYTDALHSIVRESGPLLMEKPSLVLDALAQIGTLGVPGARRFLAALMPVIKNAMSLRDATILHLRKALFSPQAEYRKIGVTGILLFLKNIRMNGSVPVTQMFSQSQSSSLSQVAVEVHRGVKMSNEALCLEILGVLRRCFSQPAGVKLTLYQGLPDVFSRNTSLCGAILDILYRQVVVLGINNPNALCPIDFDDMMVEEGFKAQLKEPIGWFLHCCQMVLLSARELYDSDPGKDDEAPSLDKMIDLFDDLSKKISEIEDHILGIEKNADYSKNSLNWLKVEQFKNTIEALMDNVIMSGIDTDASKSSLLLQLFRKHAEFSNLTKASGQSKVTKQKGKKDDAPKAEKSKGLPLKHPNLNSTELPEHAFSIKAISNLLRVLLVDKNPAHQAAVNILRDDGPFQIFSLKMVIEKLSQVEKSLAISGEDYRNDHMFGHLSTIGKHFAHCCIFDEEADPGILRFAAEGLAKVLETVVSNYRERLLEFFETITSSGSDDSVKKFLNGLMMKTNYVLESSEFELEEKAKGVARLIILMNSCLPYISQEEKSPHEKKKFTDRVLEWSHSLLMKADFKETMSLSVELALQTEIRLNSVPNLGKQLSEKLHACLGDVNESSDKSTALEGYEFVKVQNADQILNPLSSYIETYIEVADLLISRLNSLLACRLLSSDSLTELEVAVCYIMTEVITIVGPLSTSAFQSNSSYDTIFKILGKVYVSMANLTKYFFKRTKTCNESVQISKFDSLVAKLGRVLTTKVYQLLTFEKENHTTAQKKKTVDRKVLTKKEFKTIPLLIYKLEAFEKHLIRLDGRCKLGLTNNLRPSSSRDFRLQLEVKPQQVEENESVISSDDEGAPDAESTRIDSQGSQQGQLESHSPPSKRLKVKFPFRKLL